MNTAGLIARALLLKEQLKQQPCQRCGQYYDHTHYSVCPHCSELDEVGLQRLLAAKEEAFQGRNQLGMKFFLVAVIIGFLLLLTVG